MLPNANVQPLVILSDFFTPTEAGRVRLTNVENDVNVPLANFVVNTVLERLAVAISWEPPSVLFAGDGAPTLKLIIADNALFTNAKELCWFPPCQAIFPIPRWDRKFFGHGPTVVYWGVKVTSRVGGSCGVSLFRYN